MEPDAQPSAKELRTRIRQLKWYLAMWLLVAVLYGAMFVLTLVLHRSFDAVYLAVALAMAGGVALDVLWIRSARRQLRAIESA